MYGVIYVRLFDYLTTNLNNLQRLGFCDLNMLLPNFRNDYQSLFAVKSGSMSSTCFVFLFIPAEKLFIFLKLEAHIQCSFMISQIKEIVLIHTIINYLQPGFGLMTSINCLQ